jgi:hypothetical protein
MKMLKEQRSVDTPMCIGYHTVEEVAGQANFYRRLLFT